MSLVGLIYGNEVCLFVIYKNIYLKRLSDFY